MKKAFTLIELIAVIVVLSIVLAIAVPKVFDIIDSSKKGVLTNSIKSIARDIETRYRKGTLTGNTIPLTGTCPNDIENIDMFSSCTYEIDETTKKAEVTVEGSSTGKFKDLGGKGDKNNVLVYKLKK